MNRVLADIELERADLTKRLAEARKVYDKARRDSNLASTRASRRLDELLGIEESLARLAAAESALMGQIEAVSGAGTREEAT